MCVCVCVSVCAGWANGGGGCVVPEQCAARARIATLLASPTTPAYVSVFPTKIALHSIYAMHRRHHQHRKLHQPLHNILAYARARTAGSPVSSGKWEIHSTVVLRACVRASACAHRSNDPQPEQSLAAGSPFVGHVRIIVYKHSMALLERNCANYLVFGHLSWFGQKRVCTLANDISIRNPNNNRMGPNML